MMEPKDIKISSSEQEILHHLSSLLHLFHHRNKNQHRRSIWWRHFSIFRKQLNNLIAETDQLNETPKTHLERSRKKAKDRELQSVIAQRLDFWQTALFSTWHGSFSQLIANGRFAVLGLVVLAVLAQACQITGITAEFEELEQLQIESVLDQFGKEMWEDGQMGSEDHDGRGASGEDVGRVVDREAFRDALGEDDTANALIGEPRDSKVKSQAPTPLSKSTRKRREKGDAIDDLFSGLD